MDNYCEISDVRGQKYFLLFENFVIAKLSVQQREAHT